MCERELETEQNCNILTPTLLAITAFFPVLLGCSTRGILSPSRLIPNWLNFLCTELYNSSTSTFFLWASQIALIQPVHGQGYNFLIFLDRMHMLFTQVHFLFWQPGRVGGQYATMTQKITLISFRILFTNTPSSKTKPRQKFTSQLAK